MLLLLLFYPTTIKATTMSWCLFWSQNFFSSVILTLVVTPQDAFPLSEEAAACCLTSEQQAGLWQAHHSLHRKILPCVRSAFTQGEYLHCRSMSQRFKTLMFTMWNTSQTYYFKPKSVMTYFLLTLTWFWFSGPAMHLTIGEKTVTFW